MIPYFHWETLSLGPLKIYVWGLMVALGFLASFFIFWQKGKKEKLDPKKMLDFTFWLLISSLFFSRLFYFIFASEGENLFQRPWSFFALWQGGMNSMGGFFGAALVLVWFLVKRGGGKKFSAPTIRPYLESMAYAFPFGWIIGRVGCFLIHDHLGRLTNSFLGVNFLSGARFDMGLLEIPAILPLTIIFLFFSKRKTPLLFYSIFLLFWYGIARFFLDFLRATDLPNSDLRFWSLTLGQWGGLGLILIGLYLLKKGETLVRTSRRWG